MIVYVNGKEQKVLGARVYPAPYNNFESCEYITFSQEKPSAVKIIADEKIEKVIIRPLSKNIGFSYDANTIIIPECGNYNFSVEYNDKSLLIFASKKKKENYGANVIRFEAGFHDIGKMVFTEDDLTVVIEEGVYLDGKLEFNGCNNLRVCGGGVIANLSYHELKYRVIFDLLACSNVVVEDITLTDSEFWNMRIFGCSNVKINNVKIIGSYSNSDGFDVCGSKNVEISHCFTRTWDDSLVVKSFDEKDKNSEHVVFEGSGTDMTKAFEKIGDCENIRFSDCVVWNDFARPIELGVSMRCSKVSDIYFEDIDIIHSATGYPLIGSHHGDRAQICRIYFSDIRIEDCQGAQLFDFRITSSGWNKDTKKGTMHDLYFKNILFIGKPGIEYLLEMSRLEGFSEENKISNVIFENINLLGMYPKNTEELNLICNEFTENIVVRAENPNMNMVKSEIIIEKEFVPRKAEYVGLVKTVLENMSDKRVSGAAWLNISPKNTSAQSDLKFYYDLAPFESKEFIKEIALKPGKSVIRVQSDSLNIISDWKLFENPLILTKSPVEFEFVNYYGVKRRAVLSADEYGITVSSDILNDGKLIIYTAKPVPVQAGEVLYTVEETDFAKSMAVCMGRDGKHEIAPQLRCPAEIWYVFDNMPKVEKINKIVVSGEKEKTVSYAELGIDKDNFIIEFLADVPEMEKYRYPLTLFHSVTPEKSCHMFAKAVVK